MGMGRPMPGHARAVEWRGIQLAYYLDKERFLGSVVSRGFLMKRLIENLLLQVLAEPVLGLMHHLMGWLSYAVI
ncbi:hypothetical protein BK664_24565 [Pseudomonas brassicacearum]|uniref:Uncharacterized protein n=1 Tax=Pseudomonas brassicacearum TaxID=930166 RepID=A0A423J7G5_9PSED|nr:hypothetical protein BK664_24565 [Pseudomonas brassicacearum]